MGYLARRRANQERRVIAAMQPPGKRVYVLDLMWLLRMGSGTAYPILGRLERTGVVASDWESPQGDKPRRRVYWLVQGTS